MTNLIYQFWSGEMPYYAKASSDHLKRYAESIGADYILDINKPYFDRKISKYYNCFRPVFDSNLDHYENILFCDMDIFTTSNIKNNIFDEKVDKFGIVEELHGPDIRYKQGGVGQINGKNDEKWATIAKDRFNLNLPRNNKNQLRIFNSGVVLYTRKGIKFAREKWTNISVYQKSVSLLPTFYHLDQNYLGFMLANSTFTVLANKWNAQIHWMGKESNRYIFDSRSPQTCFVHIQLRGRDKLDNNRIYDITNKPINEWRHL